MNRCFPILSCCLFLLLAGQGVRAQSGVLQTLTEQSNQYRSGVLQEKIFVHTDKPWYVTGEIIWCRCWCVEGTAHVPLPVSRVAYIELLDRENRPVLQGKLGLDSGRGNGSFYLPPSLNSGVYRLRAYTSWMKNLGPASFFEEAVTIVNPFKPQPVAAGPEKVSGSGEPAVSHSLAANQHLGLYPEGGDLVIGLSSCVGLEWTDGNGRAVDGQGWLLDERNDTLESLHTRQYGRGRFRFTPVAGHTYKVVLRCADGSMLEQAVPAAREQGYVMEVTDSASGQVAVRVRCGGVQAAGQPVYLLVNPGRKVLALEAMLNSSSGAPSALFTLDKGSLQEGVNQLTLVDASGLAVGERLYAVVPASDLQLSASMDRPEYGRRQEAGLSMSSLSAAGQGLRSDLSLAVYREDSLPVQEGTDICSWLWLGSDLQGWTGAAGDYLSDKPGAKQALDDLMLTHGWRRFHWKDIRQLSAAGTWIPPEHRGQLITGKLTNPRTGLPARDIIVFLTVPGRQFRFASARTDAAGQFLFDIKDFYGTGGILLQTNTPKDSIYKIEVTSPFSEQYDGTALPALQLTESERMVLQERSLAMQVRNIYQSDSLRKFLPPVTDSLPFYGHPAYTYKLDDYTRFTTMEEVLREYVREINVNHLDGHLHPVLLNEPVRSFFDDNNALILLDGIPMADDKIFAYDPLKVNKLEIVPKTYILGPSSFSGIASFTTYKGDFEGAELDARSLLIDYDGLQPQREFYTPAYQTMQQTGSRMPDFRDLLCWAPDIQTDAAGKLAYHFYTSDVPGRYIVVVQGLTADGRIGVGYARFTVK